MIAFTLDSRHSGLEFQDTPNADHKFDVVGHSWPVLLAAFYNGTDVPVAFTGLEVVHGLFGGTFEAGGLAVETFAAVNVHNGEGLQPFLPPLLLPPKDAGAIHIRLNANKRIQKIPYGFYLFRIHVGDEIIESPEFRWIPKRAT